MISNVPVGISDFKRLMEFDGGKFYVDKSLFIRDIITNPSEVTLLLRPRRFGKTLNLSMLNYFFAKEVANVATKGLFNNLAIKQYPECMRYQGDYPVVFLTLKEMKNTSMEKTLSDFQELVRKTFEQYRFLLGSNKLSEHEKNIIQSYLDETANFSKTKCFIENLTLYLYKATGKKSIVLIDEYDTPIQHAHVNNYYDQAVELIGGIFGSGLKDNMYLEKAVLTGITRVSKESLFSGLNNLRIHSVLSNKYSEYFGFSKMEVSKLFKAAELSEPEDIDKWYNGYSFGGATIYNPWSILSCMDNEARIGPYWLNTSSNVLAKDLLIKTEGIKEQIAHLIKGDCLKKYIDEHIVYADLNNGSKAVWSLLLATGYVTVIGVEMVNGKYKYELKIPNKEIAYFYSTTISEWVSGTNTVDWHEQLINDLLSKNIREFADKLSTFVYSTL